MKKSRIIFALVLTLLSAALLMACSQTAPSISTVPTTVTSSSTPVQTSQPITSTTTTGSSLFVKILQPADESVTDSASVTIQGQTAPGADVSINGEIVTVDASGNFSQQVTLVEGPNVFDITATDEAGDESTSEMVVSYAP